MRCIPSPSFGSLRLPGAGLAGLWTTLLVSLLASLLASLAVPARAELSFVWEDRFSEAEKAKLSGWVRETHDAVERLVGEFPMGVRAYMHRRDGAREPVPWANTQRYRGQGVHFHVDPSYDLESFRRDWTAPHELSHLVLPYLGRRHAWFSEGFASYMQYPVMQAMGVLSQAEAARRYRRNLQRAARGYRHPGESFVKAAPKLRADRQYAVMYWGGAAYFLQVDEVLRQSGASLPAVLRAYVSCCRRDRASLPELLAELDRLSPTPVFSVHHRRFSSEPGFPVYSGTLAD
jgi:hypothetical protein